jgi:tetratricopeptide (TPR) repeat protein
VTLRILPLLLLLSACAAPPLLPPEPPPEEDAATAEPPPVLRPEDLQRESPAADNAAVTTLLARADALAARGDSNAAIAAAERAQRLAPRDPRVYLQLARLRLDRGEFGQAEQLALKGLSLRPGPALEADLQDVLSRSRGA